MQTTQLYVCTHNVELLNQNAMSLWYLKLLGLNTEVVVSYSCIRVETSYLKLALIKGWPLKWPLRYVPF